MTLETLATQGKDRVHSGLSNIDSSKLKRMRNQQMRECFQRFQEMHCRMEFVAKIYGKTFINDASSRNVNATLYAIEKTNGKVIWIANGNNNTIDYNKLKSSALRKVRMLLCIGENNEHIHAAFDGIIPIIEDFSTLRSALSRALYNDIEEATVLFSPACENEATAEAQGEEFRYEVNEL